MKFDASLSMYDKALDLIPMGTSTFSRNANLFVIGGAPLFIESASGCRVRDVDGNEFIDYSMSLGVINVGYAHPEINAAAKQGIDEGLVFTLACPEESQLAETLTRTIPCAEMVRFSKNGSDVCEGAVRIARHHTGKLKVITVGGYHGFHDWFIAASPRNLGIPSVMGEWILPHDYNDIEKLEQTIRTRSSEIAALIMEPVIQHEPQPGYLEKIRALTAEHNIILIFDEMKTGFRLALGGAQQYFKVVPDLAVFAKGLSNGFPLSALTGKRYLMKHFEDERCFLSASYATEKASLKAALKTIEVLRRDAVIDHMWRVGGRLKAGVADMLTRHQLTDVITIVGCAPMNHLIIKNHPQATVNEIRSFLQEYCVQRGILFVGYHHFCLAHTDKEIDYTLSVYYEALGLLRKHLAAGTVKSSIKGRVISAFSLRK